MQNMDNMNDMQKMGTNNMGLPSPKQTASDSKMGAPPLFNYELKGEFLPGVKEAFEFGAKMNTEMGFMNFTDEDVPRLREPVHAGLDAGCMQGAYLECDTEMITIDATKYGGTKPSMDIYVHKVKGKVDQNRPALVFFWGGGFVVGNAKN